MANNNQDQIIKSAVSNNEVVEGEVVENLSGDVGGSALITITNLINRYLKDIAKAKDQMKEKRQMFNDSFTNDSTYHEAEEKAKEVAKSKNKIKEQIVKSPAVSQTAEEVRGLRVELKEMEMSLSDYLKKYQEMTKSNTFEDDEGELLEIVQTAKVVKRKKE